MLFFFCICNHVYFFLLLQFLSSSFDENDFLSSCFFVMVLKLHKLSTIFRKVYVFVVIYETHTVLLCYCSENWDIDFLSICHIVFKSKFIGSFLVFIRIHISFLCPYQITKFWAWSNLLNLIQITIYNIYSFFYTFYITGTDILEIRNPKKNRNLNNPIRILIRIPIEILKKIRIIGLFRYPNK